MRIRMPAGAGKVPLVLFSHGLGSSLDSGSDWAEAWARAGIAVITIQHPGSDRGIRVGEVMAAMTAEQLFARVGDVHFVLDELARRSREGGCDLSRIDMRHVGMSGHSVREALARRRGWTQGDAAPGRSVRDEIARAGRQWASSSGRSAAASMWRVVPPSSHSMISECR